jgi:Obg family GTPase CgtA-like protein
MTFLSHPISSIQSSIPPQIVRMTNWDYYEATRRFQRILEAQGITAALSAAGARQGDLVTVGDMQFDFWEPRNRWIAELGLEDVNPRTSTSTSTGSL